MIFQGVRQMISWKRVRYKAGVKVSSVLQASMSYDIYRRILQGSYLGSAKYIFLTHSAPI